MPLRRRHAQALGANAEQQKRMAEIAERTPVTLVHGDSLLLSFH
jgi:hypothetical protein